MSNSLPSSLPLFAAAPTAIIAPSGVTRSPKRFQAHIIDAMCAALADEPRPPCLLHSPTGSGKTYMLTQVLRRISSQQHTVWLWFVPYVNLVAQTIDSLDTEGVGLTAQVLGTGLNEAAAAGRVLVSTAQAVASAEGRKTGYANKTDDTTRSMAAYVARARSDGLAIGLVVDEAHIALKSTTEFGKFVEWLQADFLLMASATPRDAPLLQFMESAGYSGHQSFSVGRADVVDARLNKRWLEAVVYPLRESMQSVTDLKMTVIRRAWRRNQKIEQDLRACGLGCVPLLLVQVGNGDDAIKEAHEFLMSQLQVPPHAIGVHSAAEPDPVMMAAIANDTSKQVLIFKQSAGTGFDAPRAFVLASIKTVNDADFATQFIGRVMRVPPELQAAYPQSASVPMDLDTAYVFLADAQAQPGFAAAAQAIQGVKSQLDGQIEQLHARPTAYGGVALSNKPTSQVPLSYNLALLATRGRDGTVSQPDLDVAAIAQAPSGFKSVDVGVTAGLFGNPLGDTDDDLDFFTNLPSEASQTSKTARQAPAPANADELFAALAQAGIRSIPRRVSLPAGKALPKRFVTEVQPMFDVLTLDVCQAARELAIDELLQVNAVKAALNRMTEKEIRTELFEGKVSEDDVQVITDQRALLEQTNEALQTLGLEDQDCVDVIQTLSNRLIPAVENAWALQDESQRPATPMLRSQARQAACWVIHKQFDQLQEALHGQWAMRAKEAPAQLLPDALLIPSGVPYAPSAKNIYGVLFPQLGEVARAREVLEPAQRQWFKNANYSFADSEQWLSVACIDGSYEFNESELRFAQALDLANFVTWWHRNPHSKGYSVGLLRSDSKNLFYPDFVVCLQHMPDEEPLMRLVDPKHDTKDARRKALHHSKYYGKVLFLTKDGNQFKIVNDNGSVGDAVDFDDLARLKVWMRGNPPGEQQGVSL